MCVLEGVAHLEFSLRVIEAHEGGVLGANGSDDVVDWHSPEVEHISEFLGSDGEVVDKFEVIGFDGDDCWFLLPDDSDEQDVLQF